MKLFTKEVDKQLFAQYPKGSDLDNQMVVAKIFNPYGRGVWYLLNSDPEDPDYIWAIVDLFEPDMGSVSRSELQTVKVPPFGLGLERDIYFSPKPAKEVFEGIMRGERFAHGGMTAGRYYKDNSGNEFRYIGESEGKLLFKDGEKIITKSHEDFEDAPKEKKLFGIFAEGGEMKQNYIVKLLDALRLAMKRSEGNRWYTHGTIVSLKGYDKMSLNYLIPNDYPISDKYKVGLQAKLSYKKDNVEYNYEFSTKNKEKSESIDNARKITWIYMPLTQDVAKQIYNQLEKQGDIKELETWSMENSYEKGGETQEYIVWVSKDGEKRELFGEYKSKRAADMQMNKLWPKGEYKQMGNKPKSMYEKEGFYADGGIVKYYDKDNEYKIGRPSGYIEKEILERVSHNEQEFVGSFGWKTSMGKMADGYLYNLNDFDRNLVNDIKLKQGEKIFRYLNRTTAIGGMRPFIKINIDKAYIYFLVNLEDDGIEFETRGIQANYIALISHKMADGGETAAAEHNIKQAKYGARLVGKQKNLDVNKNGKLDADDFKMLRGEKMAMGGKVKFEDKVKAVKESLLKRKKVSPKVQKDYGKTYDRKEALEAAKRIVGAQTAKYELKKKFKEGGKTIAQTPAPKKDRVFGSSKNKAGSASSKKAASKIELNESIVKTLGEKAKKYNENHSSKVSTSTLKAVMRRGMGAYSTSHRPTITGGAPNSRQAWGFARVNKFLLKKGGTKVKAAYVQDDDLL